MKPTQVAELLANIKKSFVSFFSILMFVALGIGIFLGISWAGPALQQAANRTFSEGSFHNFQIQFPYGLTDDDLATLSKTEGVTEVEAGRQSFQTTYISGKKKTVKVQSLGKNIDIAILVEGTLPTKNDEIAIFSESADELGLNVGDTVTFEKDEDGNSLTLTDDESSSSNPNGMKYLQNSSYTITAIINNPDYIARSSATYGFSSTPSGSVDALFWATDDAFIASAFQDGYPIVNLTCAELSGLDTYGDEYKAKSDVIDARLRELGDKLGTARYDDLHGQAQKKIDDAQQKLDDAKKKIADGERELADGRDELARKRAEGEEGLEEAYRLLMALQAEYDAALAKYNAFRSIYDDIISRIEDTKAQIQSISDQKDQLDRERESGEISEEEYRDRLSGLVAEANDIIAPARQFIEDLPEITEDDFEDMLILALSLIDDYRNVPIPINGEMMTLNQAGQKLDEAKAELDRYYAQLQDGWDRYYAGWDELNDAIAEAQRMIADGERQLAEARQQVAENEPKLEDAKAQLAAMKKYIWSVMPRSENAGAAEISVFGGVTTNLSFSMAALFIIVGLLVTYSAVSRIVHEQVTQIGTKKALGLRSKEITMSFLLYSGIAVVSGAIVGTIMGVIVVEGIIGHVLGGMFTFGDYAPYIGILMFIVVTILELVLVLGATWLACRGVLKRHAVELLRGEEPPEAKTRFYEKWGIWEKLPLFTQTIVNNCMNDKRRVFSTIVGVAGCTALIVTAITLNNDVLKSYDRHYSEVYNFNVKTYVADEPSTAIDEVEKTLQSKGSTTAQVIGTNVAIEEPTGNGSTMRIIAPIDEEAFSQVYHIRPRSGGEVDLSQDGAWVSHAYGEHFGAKVGDEILVNLGDGVEHKIKILGFYDFWLTYHEMVVGRDFYEREFGEAAPNIVLADTHGLAVSDYEAPLSQIEGFDSIVDDKTYQHGNFETFSSVSSAVVAIYLALSALMAIVVLLNLNVMFIEEKKRELIVLMINGFSVKDAKRYIYNDTIVLAAIGIICGLILGCIMGSITVGAIEPSTATFVKDVDWMAVGIGIVGSALLTLIMSVIALRRIPRFELTDINRF